MSAGGDPPLSAHGDDAIDAAGDGSSAVADADTSDRSETADSPESVDTPRRERLLDGLVARLRTWPGVLSVAIVVTIIGSWAPWSVDGPVQLGGLEASHDGWLSALYAVLAIAAVRPLRRRSWPGILVTSICGVSALTFVLADGPPPGSTLAWGWWLTMIGGLAILAAGIATAAQRWRADRNQRWLADPVSWRRLVLGGLGVAATMLLFVVFVRVLFVAEVGSWPPPDDAIAASQAQAATELFVNGSPRPRDADLEFAWSTAASVEPWAEGDAFYPRIFDDVEAAESSIHIIMFGWDSGEIGQELADLLQDKLAEGVEVRVLVDDQGSDPDGESQQMYSALVEAGAQVVANDTIQFDFDGLFVDRRFDWRQDEFGRAEHRKLYVIDGEVAWTGGAGVQDHFADGRFHDVMVRVTGDVVLQAQSVFLSSFRAHGAPLPEDLGAYFPRQPDPGSMPIALVQVIPGGHASATQATREMIDDAQHRVDVMNPYLTDTDMVQRLIAAAERGVRVRLVVAETSNNEYAEAALSHHYRGLLDAGVEIWEYPGAVVHAKVVVADNHVGFGTLNLDAWALYRDYELAMVVDDAATVELFETRLFEPDIARSRPARPPSGLVDRATAWMWDKFGYFL
jgi:cardiolipin synthase